MPKVSKEGASETIAHHAGAEIVEFSPTDALAQTIPVVLENLKARSRA